MSPEGEMLSSKELTEAGRNIGPGMVQLRSWIQGPPSHFNGLNFTKVVAPKWVLVGDKNTGITGFRSGEKFIAVAVDRQERVRLVVMGCEVIAFLPAWEGAVSRHNDIWFIE